MKFILNEKFTLNEKFILTEAEADVDAVQIIKDNLTKLQTRLNSIIKKVSDSTKDVNKNKQVLADLEELIDQAELSGDPEIVKAKIAQFVDEVIEAVNGINSLNFYPAIKNKLLDIKKIADSETIKKEDITSILSQSRNFIELLVASTDESGNKLPAGPLLSTDDSGREETIKSLNASQKIINDLLQKPEVLAGNTKEAINNKNEIIKFNSQLPATNKITIATFDEIKTACDKFNATKFKTKSDVASSQKKPWADLYKEAKINDTTNEFWKDYFQTEWEENAEAVDKFGIAFIEELEHYGFDSVTNPFVFFLKNNPVIFKKIIETNRYISLHNAVSNRLISGKDLRGNGELGKANIIFSISLYDTHGVTEFDEYLKQQKRASQTEKTQLEKQTGGNVVNVCKNIFYENGFLDRPEQASPIGENVTNEKLRSLAEIKQKLEQLIGEDTFNEKEAATTTEIDNSLKNVDEATAKQILSYFIDFFNAIEPKAIEKLLVTIPELAKTADNNRPTLSEKKKYYTQFHLDYKGYSAEQIITIIKSLAEKAGIYTSEKK